MYSPIGQDAATLVQLLGRTVSLSISDIVAVVGISLAVIQYRKNRTARQAVGQLKRSLLKQRSSQYFDELSRKAAILSSSLRSRNWAQVSELATQLGGLISSAAGFSQTLILEDEREELRLAASSLRAIWAGIPVNPEHQEITDDKVQELMGHCIIIVYAVDRVGGRMRYLGELEEEGQAHTGPGWLNGKKLEPRGSALSLNASGEEK
jgi:hypothetical protein